MKTSISHYFQLLMAGNPSGPLYSVADQALLSATNFSIGLFFIHFAEKEEYGLYSLAYGAITLVISFAGALIATPMTVSYADRPDERRERYCASMLLGQYWIFLPVIGLALAVIGMLYQLGLLQRNMTSFAAVIAVASLGGMLWEFSRRYYYLRLQPKKVLHLDICYASLMAVGLIAAASMRLSDMHWWVFVLYGLATLWTGFYALAGSGLTGRLHAVDVWTALNDAWRLGRWALGGVIVTWLQSQSFAYFLALFADLGRVADANAARLLLAPLMLLYTGLNNVVLPQLARMRSENRLADTENLTHRFMWGLTGIFLVYTVLVLLVEEKLIGVVLGDTYKGIEPLIVAWAVVNLLTVLRGTSSILMQAFKEFQAITLANTASTLVVVGITWPLIYYYGTLGSIAALGVGEVILALLLRRGFARVRQQYAN